MKWSDMVMCALISNMFCIGTIADGESFIGREAMIDSLKKWFHQSERRTSSKSIFGISGIGKTSLVKKAFRDVNDNDLSEVYVYLDLKLIRQDSPDAYYSMWIKIFNNLEKELQKKKLPNDEGIKKELESDFERFRENRDWYSYSEQIPNIFEKLNSYDVKILVVIDQFDYARDLFRDETAYYELIRKLASEPEYNNLFLILLSKSKLYSIDGTNNMASPFSGVFSHEPLGEFNDDDMQCYYNRFFDYGLNIDEESKLKIEYYCGRIPYLLSIMGYHLVEQYRDTGRIIVDDIYLYRAPIIKNYYERVLKLLKDNNNLEHIIAFVVGPNIGVNNMIKDELVSLGYLSARGDQYIAISSFFREFLISQELKTSIWDNIISVEKKLKQIIFNEEMNLIDVCKVYGDDRNAIEKEILTRNGIGIEIYLKYIANDLMTYNRRSTFFDVMSLKDTVKIIEKQWTSLFSKYFDNNKLEDWSVMFDKCALARNPVAHGHEECIRNNDKNIIDGYCKKILTCIEKCNISNNVFNEKELVEYSKKYFGIEIIDHCTIAVGECCYLESISVNKYNGGLDGIKGYIRGSKGMIGIIKKCLLKEDLYSYEKLTELRVMIKKDIGNGKFLCRIVES